MHEHAEYLRLEPNRLAGALQFLLRQVDLEVSESIDHALLPR